MMDKLLTEQANPASENIDSLTTEGVLSVIHAEDAKVAAAITPEIPSIARAVDAIVEALQRGGRLFYLGAGTSGRLGVLDASECPPTFNVPHEMIQGVIAGGEKTLTRSVEASEDDPEAGGRDLEARGFGARDVLVGIAASGRTPYVLGAAAFAKKQGARTVGISCTPDSELARAVEIAITPLTGPEVISGSTRMKAGTATKLVLNMLSTAVMIRLGYVHGNLMVNVQPRSSKLRERAVQIVARVSGQSGGRAAELLDAAAGNVRADILMGRLGIPRPEAEQRLKAAGGRLSEALRNG
jgi:N-acetylmuramic acid 6-phosphate etherase